MLHGTILSTNPLVAVFDDVFDAATTQALIDLGRQNQEQARVMTPDGKGISEGRTNTQSALDQWTTPIALQVCNVVASLVRLPPENCEKAVILRYEGAQQFKPHADAFERDMGSSREQLTHGGQRLFTTLCYLNDVDGGHTEFPDLKISVAPKRGRVLLFANTVPGSTDVHPHSIHAGRPVISGVKWVMSLWWRENLYHIPRAYPPEDGAPIVF